MPNILNASIKVGVLTQTSLYTFGGVLCKKALFSIIIYTIFTIIVDHHIDLATHSSVYLRVFCAAVKDIMCSRRNTPKYADNLAIIFGTFSCEATVSTKKL